MKDTLSDVFVISIHPGTIMIELTHLGIKCLFTEILLEFNVFSIRLLGCGHS
jgi:hypothetical protein